MNINGQKSNVHMHRNLEGSKYSFRVVIQSSQQACKKGICAYKSGPNFISLFHYDINSFGEAASVLGHFFLLFLRNQVAKCRPRGEGPPTPHLLVITHRVLGVTSGGSVPPVTSWNVNRALSHMEPPARRHEAAL